MATIRYDRVKDGEWVRPKMRGYREMCCDCSLIHRFDFRIVDGRHVEFRAFRDERATSAARRAQRLTKVKHAIDKAPQ